MPRTIGLLGGTFNPVHEGHLSIAREALALFALDAVWFSPCAVPPHKPVHDLPPRRPPRYAPPRIAASPVRGPRLEFNRPGKS
jgi:nicotinate-nucleotide adenylyltransferase